MYMFQAVITSIEKATERRPTINTSERPGLLTPSSSRYMKPRAASDMLPAAEPKASATLNHQSLGPP